MKNRSKTSRKSVKTQVTRACERGLKISQAWRILSEAEEAFAALTRASRMAVKSGSPQPNSLGEYLFWLEAAAQGQAKGRQTPARRSLVRALAGVAQELRDLGFRPTPPVRLNPPAGECPAAEADESALALQPVQRRIGEPPTP